MGGIEREGLPYRQPTNRPFSHTYSISIILFSLKKLHKVQLLVDACNVFYQPNLERQLAAQDNVIGTRTFAAKAKLTILPKFLARSYLPVWMQYWAWIPAPPAPPPWATPTAS